MLSHDYVSYPPVVILSGPVELDPVAGIQVIKKLDSGLRQNDEQVN